MNFVCIVYELGDKMLTLLSMENLIVQCNQQKSLYVLPVYRIVFPKLYTSNVG